MHAGEMIEQVRREGRTFVDEPRAKQILSTFGVRIPRGVVVRDREQLRESLSRLTFPLAAKLVSPDASHKSDVGGVRLNLATVDAVAAAFDGLRQSTHERSLRFDGVLVEEMAPRGEELVVGGLIDRRFGPVVMVGAGGVFVEIFRDVAFRICPLDPIDAAEMIDELRIAPVLRGARGRTAVSNDAIVGTLLAVGGPDGLLMRLEHAISELDINPLIVSADGAVACDARLVLSEGARGDAAA